MYFNIYEDVLEELKQIYSDVYLIVRKRQEFKNLI